MSFSDSWALLPILGVVVYLGILALALLIMFAIIRLAVSRGMRDHQMWLEKTGRSGGTAASPAPYDPNGPRRF